MATKTQLKAALKQRRRILEIARDYPLAVSRLWVPHCHRWDGMAIKSPRARGCGLPMKRINAGFWECEQCDITEARTSQIEPVLNLGVDATLIAGGNRAGKTQLAAQLAVAWAASSSEPWVKEWIKLNQIPDGIIPSKPSTVVVSALSYADALTYVRPKISQYAPANAKFAKWQAQDRATLRFENGGKIISMSASAGREAFQGFSASMIILDEEHPGPVFDECLMRVIDERGSVITTMTPLKGLTHIYDRFIDKPPPGYKSHAIYGLDNPWISSVKLLRAVRHMSPEAQASRLRGKFTNQQGLVYSEFTPNIHIIKPFDVVKEKPDWPIDFSIDFGVRNPFCCLVTAYDPKDDTLHVIDMLYRSDFTTLQNGREINIRFKKYFPIRWAVADPESRDGRLLLARECNLPSKIAPKSMGVVDTINIVKERLALNAEGRPALVVHDTPSLKPLIKEFRLYRWSTKAGRQTVIKQNDHALDALRYQVAFLYRYLRHI